MFGLKEKIESSSKKKLEKYQTLEKILNLIVMLKKNLEKALSEINKTKEQFDALDIKDQINTRNQLRSELIKLDKTFFSLKAFIEIEFKSEKNESNYYKDLRNIFYKIKDTSIENYISDLNLLTADFDSLLNTIKQNIAILTAFEKRLKNIKQMPKDYFK